MYLYGIKRADCPSPYRIGFLSKGQNPKKEEPLSFLQSLTQKEFARFNALFYAYLTGGEDQLTRENFHPPTGAPDLIQFKKGDYRIIGFKDGLDLIICTHGFKKRTYPTPSGEVEHAYRVRAKYYASKDDQSLVVNENEV